MSSQKRAVSPTDLRQPKLEDLDDASVHPDPAGAHETDAEGEDDSDFTPAPAQPAKRPKFRRVRKYTSCENCITKKIKCNRSSPCSPCVMRNQRCEWIRGKPADAIASAELTLAFTEITRLRAVVSTFTSRLAAHGLSTDPQPCENTSAPTSPSGSNDDVPIPALRSPALSGSSSGRTSTPTAHSGFDFSAPPTPSIAATTTTTHSDLDRLLHSSPPLPPPTPATQTTQSAQPQPTPFRGGTFYPPYPPFTAPYLSQNLHKNFLVQQPPPQHQHHAPFLAAQPYFQNPATQQGAQSGGFTPWALHAFPFLLNHPAQSQPQ
ncbi:hypothetical protein RQP46_002842 [Phenoliferia psychrophenolica]